MDLSSISSITFLTLVAVSLLLLTSHLAECAAAASTSQCEEVKTAYINMGYSALDVPTNVVLTGADLQICPAGFSCCTRDMEIQLAENSRQKFDQQFLSAMSRATDLLTTATADFHKYFTDEIENAHTELDAMFTLAYQDTYTNNKHVFTTLYSNFKNYYAGQDVDIEQAVLQFFKDLFVKLFVLHNNGKEFSEDYLTCVASKLETIKPFKDLPERLKTSIKHALLGSRTFIQGLGVGRNVASNTLKIEPTVACSKAHMKMTFCSHCRGLPTAKPCRNYCLNVMRGCLAYRAELNLAWQAYIDSLDMLGLRLEGDGSFNLESVLNPLKDQISSAIMDYQKTSHLINDLVYNSETGCGAAPTTDTPVRTKRNALDDLSSLTLPSRPKNSLRLKHHVDRVTQQLTQLKDLWTSSLPEAMCHAVGVEEEASATCWNGEDSASYAKILMNDGLQANANNPEVNVDVSQQDQTVLTQIRQLTQMTASLHQAIRGQTVSWLTLQTPLPDVQNTVLSPSFSGMDRSVKSSLSDSQSIASSFPWQFGSGWDERYNTEGSGNQFPNVPVLKGGQRWFSVSSGDGSGDPPSFDDTDDDGDDKEPVVPVQPHVKPTDTEEIERPLVVTIKPSQKPRVTESHPTGRAARSSSCTLLFFTSLLLALSFSQMRYL